MAGSYVLCNKLHNNGLMTNLELTKKARGGIFLSLLQMKNGFE